MEIESLLFACLNNDNQVRKQAEEYLKGLSSKPEIVPQLLRGIQQAADPQVRHLAAVLLRKRIARHWGQQTAEVQQAAKALLLERIAQEQVHAVRRAVGDVASVVAKQCMPKNEWPELLVFLQQCAQAPAADHRELALTLFSSLAETIAEFLRPGVMGLIGIVMQGVRDPSEVVRVAALKAVEPLSFLVADEPEVVAFHGLVAAMVETARDSVRSGSEDVCVLSCQLLLDLVGNPAPLMQPHLSAVIELCLEIASNTTLDLATREQALQVVQEVARAKPKQLSKNKVLMKAVLTTLCNMACEPGEDDEGEGETGNMTARAAASQAVDAISLHVASQHVHPQVLAFVRQASASADPHHRCAAMTLLAVITEGCADALRKRLDEVLPLVLAGMQDPDRRVRGAAAFAMGQFSEFLCQEVVQHYAQVLPVVFTVMQDPTPDVQERACYALDTFCENMEREILPYLPQLISKLVEVLRTAGAHRQHGVQEMALSAISSTVAAAGADFAPYVDAVLPALQHFMGAQGAEVLPCRCRATECMGLIMEHLGGRPEAAPLIPQVMELGLQGFQLEANELREYTHGMFACVAKAVGAGFAPYMAHVVPLALKSCEQDDGTYDEDEEEEEEQGGQGGNLGGVISDDDEDGEGKERVFSVRTGIMEEKCAATNALGIYAEASPAAFAPFLPQALELAGRLSGYFHEEIRAQASETMGKLVAATHVAFPPPAGAPAGSTSAETQQALSTCCPQLLEALEDHERCVVTSTFAAFGHILKAMAAQPVAPYLEQLSTAMTAALKGEAHCCEYAEDDEDGEDAPDTGGEAEEDLLAAVGDLMPVLVGAAGADAYAPVFAAQHCDALLSRLKSQQPDGVRGVVLGCVAEVAERMQTHMVPHLPRLLPPLLRELRCDDPINRQNAAFACGVLVEGCGGAAMAAHIPQILQALHPLFGPKEVGSTKDNAVGAVARMLLACPAVVPLDQVLSVYLSALPLREDFAEAQVVYRALCELLMSAETAPRIAQLVPRMVQAFGEAAVHAQMPQSTVRMLGETIGKLRMQYSEQIDGLLLGLPHDQQRALAAAAGVAS